jgi:hypothetical protein
MIRRLWLSIACSAACVVAPVLAAGGQAPSPELQKLDISTGHWVFHGTTVNAASGKSTSFTWDEHCGWSPNHLFLQCTFSNDWNGRKVESLVVDTYNSADKSYWHYEMYATGERGNNPFVSRMDIDGNVWTEHGADAVPGKTRGERIVYTWDGATHVRVVIQTSPDGVTWTTVDQADGVKQQ